jgi:hypothetical protein
LEPALINEFDKKPFLPSKNEVTQIGGGLLVVILHMAFHMSWLLPLSMLWLIPAGDRLPHVAARLSVFSLSLLVHNRLLKYKRRIFRRLFGGFVPDPFLDFYDPIVPEPTSMKVAMERNWHLWIVAALMLPIVSGLIDFNVPWADTRPSTGKYKWFNPLLEWFRTDSNTTKSLAWLFLVGSLALYGFRIRCGWIRQTQASKSDSVHW